MNKLIRLLAVLAIGLGLQSVALAQPDDQAANVRVAKASVKSLAPQTIVPGTVVSRSDARLAAEVTGRLLEVAEIGTVVAKGDVVAMIEDTVIKLQKQESERNRETVLPIRLQAYERLALLLERISPESIIMRVNKPGMTAKQLHTELLSSIRAEFDHNMSQQVYISNEAWEGILTARGKVIHLINTASDQVKDEATALTLSQQIFEMTMELKTQPTREAMQFLKKEMEQFF